MRRTRTTRFTAVAVGVWLGACYGHAPQLTRPAEKLRPEFVPAGSGVYRIERDGRPIGRETFAIESRRDVWRVEGVLRWDGPLSRSEGYWLELDASRAEPRALGLFLELVGERRSVEARVRAGYLEAAGSGPGGPTQRSVPYAGGTHVEFATPLFKAPVMSLLGPELVVGQPVFVRTIVFSLPELSAGVELVRFLLQERRPGHRLVVLERRGAPAPTALWVRPDGLVSRMRTWPRGLEGPRIEWRLEHWEPATSGRVRTSTHS